MRTRLSVDRLEQRESAENDRTRRERKKEKHRERVKWKSDISIRRKSCRGRRAEAREESEKIDESEGGKTDIGSRKGKIRERSGCARGRVARRQRCLGLSRSDSNHRIITVLVGTLISLIGDMANLLIQSLTVDLLDTNKCFLVRQEAQGIITAARTCVSCALCNTHVHWLLSRCEVTWQVYYSRAWEPRSLSWVPRRSVVRRFATDWRTIWLPMKLRDSLAAFWCIVSDQRPVRNVIIARDSIKSHKPGRFPMKRNFTETPFCKKHAFTCEWYSSCLIAAASSIFSCLSLSHASLPFVNRDESFRVSMLANRSPFSRSDDRHGRRSCRSSSRSESKAMSIRRVLRCYNLAYREEFGEPLHESLCIPAERRLYLLFFLCIHRTETCPSCHARKNDERDEAAFSFRRAFHFRTSLGFQFRDATFYLLLIRNRRLPLSSVSLSCIFLLQF